MARPETSASKVSMQLRIARLREKASLARARFLTGLGLRRGIFVPYRYAASLAPVSESYPEVEALFARSPFGEVLSAISDYADELRAFTADGGGPVLGRGMFPSLDGMATYALVRRNRPEKVIEIGAGNSTYFIDAALRANGIGELLCIDPAPRRDISGLGVKIERRLLRNDDAVLAGDLKPNDMLFIDSSHLMLPGMDVDIQFNRMFPRLAPGVLVHVHDVFLPDDYPAHWRVRNYSEQNALIGWILGGYFDVVFPSQYALTRHLDAVRHVAEAIAPLNGGGSLWLRRR